jgi:hypothetical protein
MLVRNLVGNAHPTRRNLVVDLATVPHTAFELEGGAGEPRESIEIRALVYYGGFDK